MDDINLENAEKRYYAPSGTYEYYVDGCYFNQFGQQLRSPEEYDDNAEGYTPFGDE